MCTHSATHVVSYVTQPWKTSRSSSVISVLQVGGLELKQLVSYHRTEEELEPKFRTNCLTCKCVSFCCLSCGKSTERPVVQPLEPYFQDLFNGTGNNVKKEKDSATKYTCNHLGFIKHTGMLLKKYLSLQAISIFFLRRSF